MSLYEVAGDSRPKKPIETDYTRAVNDFAKELKVNKPAVIKEMAEFTKLPLTILEIISKYIYASSRPEHYSMMRNNSFSTNYKAVVPAGFVLDDVNNAIKFFNELNRIGSLKMVDIHALEYSILAFNDGKEHLTSLTKSVEDFSNSRADMYHMHFRYDYNTVTYYFGIIIPINHTRIGGLTYEREKRQSLLEYWFPKYDEYFSKGKDKVSEAIIKEFIDECRQNVKGAK